MASQLQWAPNIWQGVSVESARYVWRVADLQKVPAAVRFLSVEPLLGPIPKLPLKGIRWVIVGGESGPESRPMDITWVRDLIYQCDSAGVPIFVKQLGRKPYCSPRTSGGTGYMLELKDPKGGDMDEWAQDLRRREFPCENIPKKMAMV